MPVGTRAAVKHLHAADLEALGVAGRAGQHLPPDAAAGRGRDRRARRAAPLHRAGTATCSPTRAASRCSRSSPKVDDDGVTFRSTYDGSATGSRPSGAVAVQERSAPTSRWCSTCARRCRPHAGRRARRGRAHGGVGRARAAAAPPTRAARPCSASCRAAIDVGLRARERRRTVEIGFDGYGIGGLSVGETRDEMLPALAAATGRAPGRPAALPDGRRRPGRRSSRRSPSASTVRLRAADPSGSPRHGPHRRRAGSTCATPGSRRRQPARPRAPARCAARWSRAYLRHLLSRSASPRRPGCSRSTTSHWTPRDSWTGCAPRSGTARSKPSGQASAPTWAA